jgi:hypothetical protein
VPDQLSFLPVPLREAFARAIYAKRPFCQASTVGVLDGLGGVTVIAWDNAPAFYQDQCFELADAVLAEIFLRQQQGEQLPVQVERAA